MSYTWDTHCIAVATFGLKLCLACFHLKIPLPPSPMWESHSDFMRGVFPLANFRPESLSFRKCVRFRKSMHSLSPPCDFRSAHSLALYASSGLLNKSNHAFLVASVRLQVCAFLGALCVFRSAEYKNKTVCFSIGFDFINCLIIISCCWVVKWGFL